MRREAQSFDTLFDETLLRLESSVTRNGSAAPEQASGHSLRGSKRAK
jgi:hypothetical protein